MKIQLLSFIFPFNFFFFCVCVCVYEKKVNIEYFVTNFSIAIGPVSGLLFIVIINIHHHHATS